MWSNPEPLTVFTIRSARPATWVFDWDGTLVDLAASPSAITVPPHLIEDLARLSEMYRGRVAVVSGRQLRDLASYIPLPNLTLVGNHGAEWRVDGREWVDKPPPAAVPALEAVRGALAELAVHWPQSRLEDKGWTLSFHVRGVDRLHWPFIGHTIQRIVAEVPALRLAPADACWEIRPVGGPTKGDAVQKLAALWSDPRPMAIFGDDWTDEDGFRAGGDEAVTVVVGSRRPTHARYCLDQPSSLRALLHEIAQGRQSSDSP
jgi:trehalose 6-phosphate phosphatase